VQEEPKVIVHVPHSSIAIPEIFRQEFLVQEEDLQKELLCMTDWYTDELFTCEDCHMVVHNVSRLVCDPERFLDPDEESMWQKGMGMYYTRTSDGERMKKSPLSSMEGWQSYARALAIYQNHHDRLRSAVGQQVKRYGKALLIDGHSFSASTLPYEFDKNLQQERPEICLGADPVFTPNALLAFAKEYFTQQGLRVAINTPFAGSMVPEPFYSNKDKRVSSLMIEVNRSLYMNEKTGEKLASFQEIQAILQRFLQKLRRMHSDSLCM
jgi:N-formylglutamate amidohydrolase